MKRFVYQVSHTFRLVLLLAATGVAVSCSDDSLEVWAGDAQTAESPAAFQWTRAEDVETHDLFLRNHGVGYSYDAVRGRYCDWQDIRCQVIDRASVEQLQRMTGQVLLTTTPMSYLRSTGKFEYSKRDYVANVSMDLETAVDFGLYKGEMRKRQHFIEDGIQESFFYTLNEQLLRLNSTLGESNLRALYAADNKSVLTMSFRNAIEHLAKSREQDIASVDSFVNVWGTHVITEAWLGGSLSIDLMNDLWRYNDKSKEEEFTSQEFLSAVSGKDEHRTGKDEFQWLEHGRLNITARGGDQSTLTSLLGEHKADGTRDFSIDGIAQWRTSIKYDPADELGSNVELVEMRVTPIWEFAELVDHFAALRIKAAILQDAALQQSLLGEMNFFDASFPVSYASATCRYREATGQWTDFTRTDSDAEPMVVNIVSGGRYVAVVCRETIDDRRLWVCYPVYEGKIKLTCGVGVAADGTACRVKWLNGQCVLTPLADKAADGRFYITGGAVGVVPVEGIAYAECQALPAIELDGGVRSDGSYQSRAFAVTKSGDAFTLWADRQDADIVGYDYAGETDGTGHHLYRRKATYTYIYNKNEIRYEK